MFHQHLGLETSVPNTHFLCHADYCKDEKVNLNKPLGIEDLV